MRYFLILLIQVLLIQGCQVVPEQQIEPVFDPADYTRWEQYAGTKDGSRYSSWAQIDTTNVSQLKEAWRFSTGDKDPGNRSQNQCNPIIIGNRLYGTSPRLKLFALDARTGQKIWMFDPASEDLAAKDDPFAYFKVNRGVIYWKDSITGDSRLFYSAGTKIYCINAETGVPVRSFGKNGAILLSENLDREFNGYVPFVVSTTPGILYGNLLIVGSRVAESDGAPGHIRAYDVKTGQVQWIFHTIPHPGEFGYDTWPDPDAWKKLGGANNWAGMSLDTKRGIVYIPTGSISDDFYGGFRLGTNLYANSLIALDAATGAYKWHYQVVHHDLWDRDLPANPNLVTLVQRGKKVDAVAQITKHGYIFLFDRVTGAPIFPIEEKVMPRTGLPGEEIYPTQPIPTLPEPFAQQSFTEADVSDLTPETHTYLMDKFRQVKHTRMFSPPSLDGVWIFPGFDGGGEWGGAAVDPETQILYVNSTELPWSMTMIEVPKGENNPSAKGRDVYTKYCLACHGTDRKGNGPSYPSLENLQASLDQEELSKLIRNGRNMMPAFSQIPEPELNSLLAFLLDLEEKESSTAKEPVDKTPNAKSVPYTMTGYNRFLDQNGNPGIKPPWGTLNAVDLNSGKLLWKVPLGEFPELTKKGIPPTGTENYGGPVVTAGGLVFIAATKDAKIRAFNKSNGTVLWEADLPVPGFATPAIYSIDGEQFVVIACGGGKIGSRSGDEYVAFSLGRE